MRKSVGIALVDQAVLSLFNLGLNLAMIRFAAPQEFGRFIFASAVVLVMTSLQNALVSTPLSVLIPGRPADEQEQTARAIVTTDVVFRLAAGLVAPLVGLLTSHTPAFLLAVAFASFSTLARETARSLVLAHEHTIECLRIDTAAVLGSIAATVLLWPWCSPAVAGLTGIAIGNTLAIVTQVKTTIGAYLPFRTALQQYYRHYWPDTQWSLVGASTTEVQYRSYVFALEMFRNAATLASVQAGRLLLGPLPLVVGAWGRVARPAMARALAAGNSEQMLRITTHGMVYVLSVAGLYCGALYLAWPTAERIFFGGKYADVAIMTVAWGAYMIVVVAHMVLSVPLQAAMRLKELAQVTIATAVLTCLLLTGLMFDVPPVWSVMALIVAEIVSLAWILLLVTRLARDPAPLTPRTVVSGS